ncbi:MAG: SPOR domain-containing protein, partial [Sphingomicrobium sp.]
KETLAQLDKLMPVTDRQKAVALALARAKTAPPPSSKPAKRVRQAQARPTPPKNVQAPADKPSPPASGAWRIQLGAFSQRGAAEALYNRLSSKPALAGRGPFYVAAGPVTRLQVGPFISKAAAAAACSAVGTACFPVPAK